MFVCTGCCSHRRNVTQHKETCRDHPEFDALAAPAIAGPAVAQPQDVGSPSAPPPELLQASQARLDRQGTLATQAEQSMLTQFKQERYTDEATARHFLKQADWNLDRAMEQYMPPVPASPVSDRTFSTSRFKASCECRCRLVHCLIAFAYKHLHTPSLRCVDVVARAPEGPMDLGARFFRSLFSRDYI